MPTWPPRLRSALPPGHAAVLLACAVAVVAHQALRWGWMIDDAAIVFAYARNLATGEGAVPWPGGERVEAYSDPTWVALLAALYAVGLDGFTVAKPLGMAFGVGTLGLTYHLGRLALPGPAAPRHLFAPILLAASAQFAIWSASGLENGLFCLLLAWAIAWTTRDVDRIAVASPRHTPFPWAVVPWLLIAWTRPEGLAYAAIGCAVFGGASAAYGANTLPLMAWISVFGGAFAASELARIAYFAWPLPNTFYAKIASRGVAPLDWDSRGWNQLREWADRLWYGYYAPVIALGVTGPERRRATAALAVVGVLGASLLWPGTADLQAWAWWPKLPDPPAAAVLGRLLALAGAGAALPLLAIGTPGGVTRLLCGLVAWVGLAFHVYADGDWMGAYRFTSLVSPALAVLMGCGLAALADAIGAAAGEAREAGWGPIGWSAAALGAGAFLPPNLSQTRDHALYNVNETTASVRQRVEHTKAVVRRTFWDEPVTNLDVDQGAHLWWAPEYTEIDMAMLVDIPMARHWYQQRAFIAQYVFEEHPPTFAHVGGWWAKYTGFRRYPGWDDLYFELPPYVDLRFGEPFRNVFARRELLFADRWEDVRPADAPDRRVRFDWNLALEGVAVPAPWTGGQLGYLEAAFSVGVARKPGQDVTVTGFLARERPDATGRPVGEVVASFDLPMGYGLLPMDQWAVGDVFRGRHAVPVPEGLAPGRYTLGFVLRGPRGYVIPPIGALPPGARSDAPVFSVGEVRFPGAVEVVDGPAHAAHTAQAVDAVGARARASDCAGAEEQWRIARRHRPYDDRWLGEVRGGPQRWIADCWARAAEAQPRPLAALSLARAHRWDPRSPELARVGAPIAEELIAEGSRARDDRAWARAYARYASVLRFQPWRAWVRRWAEQMRDRALGLDDDVRIGIGGENDLRALEDAERAGAVVPDAERAPR